MDTSTFLAQIFGLVYIVVGIGFFLNKDRVHRIMDDLFGNAAMVFFAGVVNLVVGFLLITYHNIWEQSWVVLLTIIGWIALLKGVVIILWPDKMQAHARAWASHIELGGAIAVVLGLIFAYYGFMA